jgi:hypothetical protein
MEVVIHPSEHFATYDEENQKLYLRVVKAREWSDAPVSVFTESVSAESLAARAVEKIKAVKSCRVFITRHPKAGYLKNVLERNNFKLEEER